MRKIIIVLRDHAEDTLLTATFSLNGTWFDFLKELIELTLKCEEWHDRDILIYFREEK